MKIFLLYFFSAFCIFMFCYTKFFKAKQYETETTVKLPKVPTEKTKQYETETTVKLPGVSTEKTKQYETETNLLGSETKTTKIDTTMSSGISKPTIDSSKTLEGTPYSKESKRINDPPTTSEETLQRENGPSVKELPSDTDKDEEEDEEDYYDYEKYYNDYDAYIFPFATSTLFPYYVFIRSQKYYHPDAGSIISPIWILTTAEILFRKNEVFITLQPLDRENSFMVLSTGLLPHPKFQQFPILYNIGLVKCPEITFNDEVNLIKLPSINSSPNMLTGANFLVVGHVVGLYRGRYQYRKVKISDGCIAPENIDDGLLCTEFADALDKEFYVFIGQPLAGNTSSGEHILFGVSTALYKTRVYTSTSIFRQWIKDETGI